MYQTKIASASGRYAVDTSGASLYNIGNVSLKPGDYAMTDGRCIYGRHNNQGLADIPVGGYVYPFYNPKCTVEKLFDPESKNGLLCGMKNNGDVKEFSSNIAKGNWYANACVAGKKDLYFIQSIDKGYKAYNMNTGKSFAIYSEKMNSFFLDACVDDDGNLLTAFGSYDDEYSKSGANGILVFKNDSIIHRDPPLGGGVYNNIEFGYMPVFVFLRKNGTYIGVFSSNSYYTESESDLSTVNDKVNENVDITKFKSIKKEDGEYYNEYVDYYENVNIHKFNEFNDSECIKHTSKAYSHFREVLYDSSDKSKTEIMHITCCKNTIGHYIKNPVVNVNNTSDEYYSAAFHNHDLIGYTDSTFSYSTKSKEFSIIIGENQTLKFSPPCTNNPVYAFNIPYVNSFMNSHFSSTVSILGLEKNIGKSKIVDVKTMDDGSYLILTSDGVYTSDGSKAKLLCEDFKSWCNNFRLNSIPSSMLSRANSIVGGIE